MNLKFFIELSLAEVAWEFWEGLKGFEMGFGLENYGKVKENCTRIVPGATLDHFSLRKEPEKGSFPRI